MATQVLYYDIRNTRRCFADGSTSGLPAIYLNYQSAPVYELHLIDVAAVGDVDPVDMSDAVTFRASVDKDFLVSSEPMCRTLNANIDSTSKATGVIKASLDADTSTFLAAVDGQPTGSRKAYFELKGYDSSSKEVYTAQFEIYARGSVDPAGGTPPDPVSDYWTKDQSDARYATAADVSGKADKQGNEDIIITDATKGLILRTAGGQFYRIGVVMDGATPTLALAAVTITT